MFANFDAAYKAILQELLCEKTTIQPRGRLIYELEDYVWKLLNVGQFDDKIDFTSTKAADRQPVYDAYVENELRWYISGNLRADSAPSKFWLKLADDRGTISSNYGYMVLHDKKYRGLTAFQHAVAVLQEDRDSRQAILHYSEPRHHWPGNKDVPCTVAAHAKIRNGQLNMHVFQRSADVIKGLSYDVPWHCWLMRKMACELAVSTGSLVHTCGSMHLYHDDIDLAKKICTHA